MGVCSLNHDTTTSYSLGHTRFPEIHPHLHMYYGIRVYPYAHPQHLKVLKHFVYIHNMDVGYIQWGFAASTMTPQHHTGSAIPHFPKIHFRMHMY